MRHREVAAAQAAVVGLAVVRLVAGGWAPVALDDGRYLYVGLSALGGDGLRHPLGFWNGVHSPLYPLALASVSRLAGGDLFTAPRVLAFAVSALGLVLAVRAAWLLGGVGAASVAALALAATPVVWVLLPSLGIDLVQSCLVVGLVVAMGGAPSTRRWAAAGVLLGAAILVKETAALLVLLPVAWVGAVPAAVWYRRTAVFLGVTVATAGWWWVLVWVRLHEVFPLNALTGVEARPGLEPRPFTLGLGVLALVALHTAAWIALAVRFRSDPRGRTLLIAGLAMVVPAAYAWTRHLGLRHFVVLAVLSAIALGAVAAEVGRRVATATEGRSVRAALAGVVMVALLAGAVVQGTTEGAAAPAIGPRLAAWLRDRVGGDDRVVMTRRFSYEVAARLHGDGRLATVRFRSVDSDGDLDDFLWVGGGDDGWAEGVRRDELIARLRDSRSRYLVFTGPDSHAAPELRDMLAAGALAGVRRVTTIRRGTAYAVVLAVAPEDVPAAERPAPTVTGEAASWWLDAGGDPCALVSARMSDDSASSETLRSRIGRCPDQ